MILRILSPTFFNTEASRVCVPSLHRAVLISVSFQFSGHAAEASTLSPILLIYINMISKTSCFFFF